MRRIALLLVFLATPLLASAQTTPPLTLRAEAQADGPVYLYLSRTPDAAGVHVWREAAGQQTRLTITPLARFTDTDALPALLGEDFDAVAERMGTRDAVALLARLGRRSFDSEVLVRLYPGAARVAGRLLIDETAQPGVRYTYRLTAGHDTTATAPTLAEVTVAAGSVTTPAAVDGLSAERDAFEMALTWRYAPEDVAGERAGAVPGVAFEIEQTDEASGEAVSIALGPIVALTSTAEYVFTDTTAIAARAYRYAVVARSASGLTSAPSEIAVAPAPDVTAPFAVQDVSALQQQDESPAGDAVWRDAITITWAASPAPDLAGYHVYRSPVERDAVPQRLTSTPIIAATFDDASVRAGERYGYTVRALDRAGNESAPSVASIAIVRVAAPPTPSGFGGRADETGARLVWNPVGGSTTALRLIRQQTGRYGLRLADAPYLPVGRFGADRTTVSDADASEPGARYRYALVALNTEDAPSDTAFVEVAVPDRDPPSAPAALRATNVLARRVEIVAEPSRAPDVARHVLMRSAVGAFEADTLAIVERRAAGLLPAIRYEDAAVALGQRYVYALIAEDHAGNRSLAARDTVAFRDADAPPAPRLPNATEDAGRIRLIWHAAPADDVLGYHIYRAPSPGTRGERLTSAPATALAWTGPATPGWYTIRTLDTSGNESEPSVPVRVGE